jgi:DNA-binding response OmpR family regulator
MRDRETTVAVINTSPDIIDLLRRALEPAGFVVVTAMTFEIREGRIDLQHFIEQHDPRVVVYDIAPPYDANWRLFRHLAGQPWMAHRQFVITSVNAREVDRVASGGGRVYEVVGKPYDLDQIVNAVREASRSRPTREEFDRRVV